MHRKLNRFKYCVTILLILEILAGIILICITGGFHRILVLYLAKCERQSLYGQLGNIYMLGLELLVCYTFGLLFWRYIWKSEAIIEHTKLLVICNSFSLLVIVCGSATVWLLYSNLQALQNAAANSLFQGIDLYFSDPERKLLLDEIQYNNECCGVDGYEDWREAVWVPEEQRKCQSPLESNIAMLIPYACCKRTVLTCFQNYAPHLTPVAVPYLNASDINTSGCLPKFNSLTSQLINSLACVMLIAFTLQILLFVFVLGAISTVKKILFTSSESCYNSDERPLVVVKYPRNVRCITLTDEENFDEADEVEEEQLGKKRKTTEGICLRMDITDSENKNIFVH